MNVVQSNEKDRSEWIRVFYKKAKEYKGAIQSTLVDINLQTEEL